jgi:hypothetical protein
MKAAGLDEAGFKKLVDDVRAELRTAREQKK